MRDTGRIRFDESSNKNQAPRRLGGEYDFLKHLTIQIDHYQFS